MATQLEVCVLETPRDGGTATGQHLLEHLEESQRERELAAEREREREVQETPRVLDVLESPAAGEHLLNSQREREREMAAERDVLATPRDGGAGTGQRLLAGEREMEAQPVVDTPPLHASGAAQRVQQTLQQLQQTLQLDVLHESGAAEQAKAELKAEMGV
jgi:hypothetical protein